MPRILGIDASLTATGLCQIDLSENDDGPVPKYGPPDIACLTVGAPKPTADKSARALSRRVSALLGVIEAAIADEVSLIVLEELAYGAKGSAVYVLPWVWGRVIDLAEAYDRELLVINVSSVKKYATGKGNASKSEVVAAVVKRWPQVQISDDNQADALTLAAIGCRYLGLPIDTMPKANWEPVMAKLGVAAEPAAV